MGYSGGAISKLTKAEFDHLLEESTSTRDFMRRLGLTGGEGTETGLCARLIAHKSDVSHWANDPRQLLAAKYLKVHNRATRKSRPTGYNVAYDYLRPGNHCEICDQGPIWNGERIEFEIDHIDGDAWNCLLCNLRRVCPNCHRQQSTSSAGHAKLFAIDSKKPSTKELFQDTLTGRNDWPILEKFYSKELLATLLAESTKGTSRSFWRHAKGEGLPQLIRVLERSLNCTDIRKTSYEELRTVLKIVHKESPKTHGFALDAISILAKHDDLKDWERIGNRRRTRQRLPNSSPLFGLLVEAPRCSQDR